MAGIELRHKILRTETSSLSKKLKIWSFVGKMYCQFAVLSIKKNPFLSFAVSRLDGA